MNSNFEIGKSLSAAICALLFGSTMILSAVGPARASSDVGAVAITQSHQSPAVTTYLA